MRPALVMITALCTLVVTSIVIKPIVGDPLSLYATERSERLAMLDQNISTANAAVFGSSHMTCGLDPRAFDAARGATSVTLNLAVQGGAQTEQRAMAARFLSKAGQSCTADRPCDLFLELNAGLNLAARHLIHPRSINIYDWRMFTFAAQFDQQISAVRHAGRSAIAATATTLNFFNVGMLSARFFPVELDRKRMQLITADGVRGYACEEAAPPLKDNDPVFGPLFAKVGTTPPPAPQTIPAGLIQAANELQATARANVFLIVTPAIDDIVNPRSYEPAALKDGKMLHVLNAADASRYPALYRAPHWRDATHLSDEGAKVFARAVACELAKLQPSDRANCP